MSCRPGILILFIAAVLGVCPGVATGQTLYGLTAAVPQQLITIDPTTGAGTLVGNLTFPVSGNGLAFRGAKLYTFDFQAGMRQLDPATANVLATINIGLISPSWNTGGLAFRSDGIGFLGDGPNSLPNTSLYSFDITVPSNTQITANYALLNSSSLAFSPADVLYAYDVNTSNLDTINQATGVPTVIGNTGIAFPGTSALAFDGSGNLYLAMNSAGPGPASDLYTVNPVTAVATKIGPIGFTFVQGLAFSGGGGGGGGGGSSPAPSPAPGGVGEGSFAGTQDASPSSSEGGFGHVSDILAASPRPSKPVLAGPFLASSGASLTLAPSSLAMHPPAGTSLQVYNTAGSAAVQVGAPQASSGTAGALGFTMLAALGLAVGVGTGTVLWTSWSTSANATAV